MSKLTVHITETKPTISEIDRQRGYIYRYFAAKANQLSDKVYEVSLRDYNKLNKNPYVVVDRMKWVIRGKLEDTNLMVHTGNVLGFGGMEEIRIPGVLTENAASVKFVSERIPAVERKITNLQEFYQDVNTES